MNRQLETTPVVREASFKTKSEAVQEARKAEKEGWHTYIWKHTPLTRKRLVWTVSKHWTYAE